MSEENDNFVCFIVKIVRGFRTFSTLRLPPWHQPLQRLSACHQEPDQISTDSPNAAFPPTMLRS